jgi:hypothetical protein
MESATQPATSAPAPETESNDTSPAAETIEVRRPADGSLIETVPVDSPERVAEVAARVRASQPA